MTIALGQPAPAFSAQTDDGPVSLADFRGRRLVLYFYPKDDTSGCTGEAKAFRDAFDRFAAAGAAILGVSRDPVASHRKFRAKHALPFPLIADEDGSLSEAFGVWKEKSMYGRTYMGIERSTFLIDEAGVVTALWRKVKVSGHAAAVLKALAG
ncbi:MAG: thioredoxin-dependent thiol peroxidase [Magnetospirillum sp.]|nr:thioredoxin-dependent thiol peroxidase [Magnetospirillum sp.]